ncbi:MAG: Ig-like domain-containing protein [Bacteroidales bacterium]|nr:Ig-like domain-containing protein [Bacteroidales bacterium]
MQPTLTVTKTKTSPASGPFTINENITYNIAITNTGASTLTHLPLQDLYSTGCIQYVSSSHTPSNISGGVITWNNLGSLAPSNTINVTLTMKVEGNCDPAANTARVEGAKDGSGATAATQTSTVNINIDVPPVANADSYCIQASTALSVLGNDTDADVAGSLSVPANAALYNVTIFSAPAKGSVTVNGDKTIQFNPLGGSAMSENETVTFVYRVAEIAYPTFYSDATVTVLYSAVNSPPTAVADIANTTAELPVTINVLANDSDPDGIMTVSQITAGPSNGLAVINANNTITYTPFPGFAGTDVFTYQVCDDGCPLPSECSTATVTISVVYAYYVCQEGTSTISVPEVPGATGYVWDLPLGAVVVEGDGTNELTVDWSGVSTGSYEVCVEPENYCGPGTEQCVNVVVNKVALVLTPNHLLCNGINNGSINLDVTGGIAPYTYVWTRDGGGYSASVQNPGGLSPGTYNVTVTDKYGCTASGSTEITQPATAVSVIGSVTNATYPSSNGSIDITASGGTGAYTYAWSNGATTEDLTGLAGGTYHVTVTDANGCTAVKYFTVNSIGSPLEISSTLVTHVKCNGQSTGAIDIEAFGGNGTYTYSWTRDGGGFTAITQDISDIPAGTYNVTVSSPGYTSVVLTGIVVSQPAILSASSIKTDVSSEQLTSFTK